MQPIALYLHIPFCETKCTYCDFNSYAGLNNLVPDYTAAIKREVELWSAYRRFPVRTVFLGGGTPSEMPLSGLAEILETVRAAFDLDPNAEVSLEANPGTVDLDYLEGLLAIGVNRLSLGVQSFDDVELRSLTRIHSAEQARQAFRDARQAGFRRINLDLIYGLPHQRLERWLANLQQALELHPDHLSLYALSVEPGTVLYREVQAGKTLGPDGDLQAEMYEHACERLQAAGYGRYEISNWSLSGQECRHNLVYWRNEPYLGLGCGAHSYLESRRFSVIDPPRGYVRAVGKAQPGDPWGMPQMASIERIPSATEVAETIMLGLRLDEGISRLALRRRFSSAAVDDYEPTFHELTEIGLLADAGDRLRLTARGILMGNEVFERILMPV